MLPYRLFLLRRKPRYSAVVSGTEALYPSLFPCHLPFVDCGTTDAKLVSNPALGPMLLEIWHGFHSSRFHFLLDKFVSISQVPKILQNVFYLELMKYKDEIYEGTHEPIISKKLFDKVQEVLKERGKPQKVKKHYFAFLGLMKCPCSAAITAEKKIKSSGKEYIYYRCTKKKGPCQEKHFLRDEELYLQIKSFLQKVSLSSYDTEQILAELEKEELQAKEQTKTTVQNLKEQLTLTVQKLEKLLDVYLEETITAEEYASRKNKLVEQKVGLQE